MEEQSRMGMGQTGSQPPTQPGAAQSVPTQAPAPQQWSAYQQQGQFQQGYAQPGYGQPAYGQPGYGQPAFAQPAQPVFSKNALQLGAITLGAWVGLTLAAALVANLLMFLLLGGRSAGAKEFFAGFYSMIALIFGASSGHNESSSGSIFFLTMTIIVFVAAFMTIRKMRAARPLTKKIDLVMSVVVPSFGAAVLLTIIVAIMKASTMGYFSWAALLFTSWFWMMVISFFAQKPSELPFNPQMKQNMTKLVEMLQPSLKSYGVLAIGMYVFYLISTLITFIIYSNSIKFGEFFGSLILTLGQDLLLAPYRMMGAPLSVDSYSLSYYQGEWWMIILTVLATIVMLLVVAIAVAIFRKGNESWIDLGVIVGLWFVFSLFTMWVTAVSDGGFAGYYSLIKSTGGAYSSGNMILGGLSLLLIMVFAVVVDLLARFVVPYIARAVPSLGQKYPYLTQMRQAERLFGAPSGPMPGFGQLPGQQPYIMPGQQPYGGQYPAMGQPPMQATGQPPVQPATGQIPTGQPPLGQSPVGQPPVQPPAGQPPVVPPTGNAPGQPSAGGFPPRASS
ncbi:MAG: hypothetical protein Q4P66_07600 [Actinomycetaceae bacterium]|nr:hypothetical protein [Actinomycetaceae bacterium]